MHAAKIVRLLNIICWILVLCSRLRARPREGAFYSSRRAGCQRIGDEDPGVNVNLLSLVLERRQLVLGGELDRRLDELRLFLAKESQECDPFPS